MFATHPSTAAAVARPKTPVVASGVWGGVQVRPGRSGGVRKHTPFMGCDATLIDPGARGERAP